MCHTLYYSESDDWSIISLNWPPLMVSSSTNNGPDDEPSNYTYLSRGTGRRLDFILIRRNIYTVIFKFNLIKSKVGVRFFCCCILRDFLLFSCVNDDVWLSLTK